jgi:hypothetical protein
MAFDYNLEGNMKIIFCRPLTVLSNRPGCLTFVVFV